MNQILNTQHPLLSQFLRNHLIVGDRDPLTIDFSVSSLVDQVSDGGDGRTTVSDVGFDESEHLTGSTGHSDKDTVVAV